MGIILKGVLAIFWLVLVPAAAGIPLLRKKQTYTLAESFFAGYIFLFSIAEILTLPMIFLKAPLHVLTISYGAIAIVMAAWGCVSQYKKINKIGFSQFLKLPRFSMYFWCALVLIAMQTAMCVLMAHMDADDCFFVATATTDVYTNTIFSVSPYTGLRSAWLQRRYVLSPFPVFLAVVSQLSGGLHSAIMAHIVYPAVFLPMAYMVLFYIGKKWFRDNSQAQGIFLLMVSVLSSFSAYSVYNAGNFQMVRIWQGKAFLAAIMLPLLFYFCITILMEKQPEYPWIFLLLTNLSCCMLSSMGIILAPLMQGCFVLISLIQTKNIKHAAKGLLCCLPSLILGVCYLLLG